MKKSKQNPSGLSDKSDILLRKDDNVSYGRSEKLIEALNSAIFSLQTSHTREEIFRVVAEELKKMNIESMVMTASDDLKTLSLEYFSFHIKLIKAAEKVAKMTIGQLKLNIHEIKEYEDVLLRRKTVFVINTVEFVRKVLPEKLKFMANQLIKSLKISKFILAPLIVENRVIGIFSVQANDLLESDIPEVTMFAHQLAGIWNKVELLENANREIAERKAVEQALRNSEERFSKAFQSSPFAISISEQESGKYIDINEKFMNLTGFTREEIIGKSSVELGLWLDKSVRKKVVSDLLLKGSIKDIETDFKNKSGQIRTWKSSLELMEINGRNCILSLIDDITEERKAIEELRNSEERFAKTFTLSPYVIGISDLENGKYIDVNDNFIKLTGISKDDIIGKSATDLNFYVDNNLRDKIHLELLSVGSLKDMQAEIKVHTGEIKTIKVSMEIMKLKGRPCILSIAEDITEKIKIEKALQENEELFRKVFEESSVGMVMSDEESNFIRVNEVSCKMLGYTEEELKSLTYLDITHPDYTKFTEEIEIVRKIKTGELNHYKTEKPYLKKNKEIFWGSLTLSSIRDSKGEFRYFLALIEDISERKEAERKLSESNRKINTLINNLPGVVYRCLNDNEWTMEYISDGIFKLTGFPASDFINNNIRTYNSIIETDDQTSVWENIQKEIQDGHPFTIEYKIRTASGQIKWVWERGVGINENGKIAALEGYITDITEQKKADEENILLAHTVRSVTDAISLTDMNNRVIYVNDAFLETYGYKEDEIIGKNISILSPMKYSDISKNIHNETLIRGWHGELINKRKDGTEFSIELWTSVVRDTNNNILATVGVARDITERKKAEDEIKNANDKLVQAQRVAKIGNWEDYLPTGELSWSKEMYSIFELNENNKVNLNEVVKVFPKEELERFLSAVNDTVNNKKPYSMDYKIIMPDGRIKYIHDEGEVKIDEAGNPVWMYGTTQDITDRKSAEAELIKAKDRAEEMNKVKSSFLANMSHEVRTPLVAILGFSEVLEEIVKDPQLKNYVEMIHAGGVRLLDTLNLILDLSVIESQKINIKLKPVNIIGEVKDAAVLFGKFADKKSLKLNMFSAFECLVFDTDEKILRQILNNLINNAIKYTDNGSVTINIDKEVRGNKYFVALRVEDTGIGIPKDKQELIWDEFRQVSEGINRSFEGAGLGLSITKKFVEKLGGEIMLEKSEVDIGSVFKVLFPVEGKVLAEAKYAKQPEEIRKISIGNKNEKSSAPKILYIDDDSVSLEIVKAFTKDVYDMDTSLTGRDGIEKCKRRIYDAVLMDINLGQDMDGLQATEILRELKEYKNVPVVAVTAYAMVGDKEKFFKRGCTHYISKPFNKKELLDLLSRVFKNKM